MAHMITNMWHVFCVLCTVIPLIGHYLPVDLPTRRRPIVWPPVGQLVATIPQFMWSWLRHIGGTDDPSGF
jgi:hypothetical protein